MEISVRVGLEATDIKDNCRGEYLDYEDEGDAVAGHLVEIHLALLGWQQLESAQPKKMVLSGNHFWCVSLWDLMRLWMTHG